MPENTSPKPFIVAANKTAYYFAEGLAPEQALEALFDLRCHVETEERHVCENGEIYRIVRIAPLPSPHRK